MTIETSHHSADVVRWQDKINPLFWLTGDGGWTAPTINNGTPYLPDVKNQLLRNFYWWCRNPIGNFVGYIIGVQDRDFDVIGPAPVELVTWDDAPALANGRRFKWSVINAKVSWKSWILSMAIMFFAVNYSVWLALPALILMWFTVGVLPFASWAGPKFLWYIGWRPNSGAFGIKFNIH